MKKLCQVVILPTKKENYTTTLFISGPAINSAAKIPYAHLIDEGPTFLHAIGLSYPQPVDGRILIELFNEVN